MLLLMNKIYFILWNVFIWSITQSSSTQSDIFIFHIFSSCIKCWMQHNGILLKTCDRKKKGIEFMVKNHPIVCLVYWKKTENAVNRTIYYVWQYTLRLRKSQEWLREWERAKQTKVHKLLEIFMFFCHNFHEFSPVVKHFVDSLNAFSCPLKWKYTTEECRTKN